VVQRRREYVSTCVCACARTHVSECEDIHKRVKLCVCVCGEGGGCASRREAHLCEVVEDVKVALALCLLDNARLLEEVFACTCAKDSVHVLKRHLDVPMGALDRSTRVSCQWGKELLRKHTNQSSKVVTRDSGDETRCEFINRTHPLNIPVLSHTSDDLRHPWTNPSVNEQASSLCETTPRK
jgi:hypothetical protein